MAGFFALARCRFPPDPTRWLIMAKSHKLQALPSRLDGETHAQKIELMRNLLKANPGASTSTQRKRILAVLQAGFSLSTLEIRRNLDVLAPAVRVKELRNHGYKITTTRIHQVTESGLLHWRVALYTLVLKGGAAQ